MAVRFPVEAGHILMFARAIGDENPIYADEAYAKTTEAGSIIAPPTFTMASIQFEPEYHLRPKSGEPWVGSGKNPTGLPPEAKSIVGGLLHAEQHFEYHRPLKPGDVLTATRSPGKTWEKEGRRSGKLTFSETVTEYRDQAGELVVTARGVSVVTERTVDPAKEG